MTEKDLSRYYNLKREVQDLEERIAEFGSGVKSAQIKDVAVSGSKSIKSIQETKVELVSLLKEKRISALEEYLAIERYIESVEDVEIRNIMRYRFLDLMKWEEIGEKLYQDRTWVAKKVRKYLNGEKKAHKARS